MPEQLVMTATSVPSYLRFRKRSLLICSLWNPCSSEPGLPQRELSRCSAAQSGGALTWSARRASAAFCRALSLLSRPLSAFFSSL